MKASLPAELQDGDVSDDSDEIPSSTDEEDLDDEDEEDTGKVVDEDEDDDAFSLVEGSDAEDLLPLDADVPVELIEYDGTGSEAEGAAEEWGGIGEGVSKKRKRNSDEDKKKRKKIRSLPTFASYEDYAKMIEDAPEDNI